VARFPTVAGTCRKNAARGYAYRSRANAIEMSLWIFAHVPLIARGEKKETSETRNARAKQRQLKKPNLGKSKLAGEPRKRRGGKGECYLREIVNEGFER